MENPGQCLCGGVRWRVDAEPYYAFNCHCKLCRKAHGTAFATYWFFKPHEFRWLQGEELIKGYRSSAALKRSFCNHCGSVVPYISERRQSMVVPAGCHDEGRRSDCEIFVAHAAPWFEISGDLPKFDDYPPDTGLHSIAEPATPESSRDSVQGSCLCGAVEYRVVGPVTPINHCHCQRCRRARAAAHATNGLLPIENVAFERGEDNLCEYKVPEARYFTQVYCRSCGSKLPRLDFGRGIAVVPLGSLDDAPNTDEQRHIFVANKAGWHHISDHLPQFAQGPG